MALPTTQHKTKIQPAPKKRQVSKGTRTPTGEGTGSLPLAQHDLPTMNRKKNNETVSTNETERWQTLPFHLTGKRIPSNLKQSQITSYPIFVGQKENPIVIRSDPHPDPEISQPGNGMEMGSKQLAPDKSPIDIDSSSDEDIPLSKLLPREGMSHPPSRSMERVYPISPVKRPPCPTDFAPPRFVHASTQTDFQPLVSTTVHASTQTASSQQYCTEMVMLKSPTPVAPQIQDRPAKRADKGWNSQPIKRLKNWITPGAENQEKALVKYVEVGSSHIKDKPKLIAWVDKKQSAGSMMDILFMEFEKELLANQASHVICPDSIKQEPLD
ncbi:hypothetical protein PGT21_036862 [Puccinia graminis f. sp. tritici]|uniref:Uncharacterized protein n=2 Tax=Puccinia graminis f. sp. tritici TaxID=56615 RepID=E3LBX3_PUCGT|nr:uncharacterized protein PGTG_19966 [Puccinia graminis f. sp. tritici CRL 75-36-700-3]EFP94048.2 hypothetical protein PGTG_19966 [Puccinia graminis f. sp. tritici CRL 75-36-700-3]KAA1102213.1 hypothetical protein PGT21_036862 [Puccinia graminis f. sp. tritici]